MTDVTAATGTTPPIASTWPDAIVTLQHYLAGLAILGFAFAGMYYGKISADVFTPLLFGAAAAVGFKMNK